MFSALAACDNDGPAERAGEDIDNAVDDLRDNSRDLGNKIEDQCEKLKEEAGTDDTDC
jgi:hypothetical protein